LLEEKNRRAPGYYPFALIVASQNYEMKTEIEAGMMAVRFVNSDQTEVVVAATAP